MTQARTPHSPARPTLTGGADRPATPCLGNWLPWDVMLTHKAGTQQHEAARRDAADLCAQCPLTRCGYRIGRANAA